MVVQSFFHLPDSLLPRYVLLPDEMIHPAFFKNVLIFNLAGSKLIDINRQVEEALNEIFKILQTGEKQWKI